MKCFCNIKKINYYLISVQLPVKSIDTRNIVIEVIFVTYLDNDRIVEMKFVYQKSESCTVFFLYRNKPTNSNLNCK